MVIGSSLWGWCYSAADKRKARMMKAMMIQAQPAGLRSVAGWRASSAMACFAKKVMGLFSLVVGET